MFNSDPVKATRMDRMDTDTRQAEAKAVPATQGIGEAAVIAKNLGSSVNRVGEFGGAHRRKHAWLLAFRYLAASWNPA